MTQDPMVPRCTAKSKQSGEQCKQRPIPGGTVCRFHGGSAPAVKAKALERTNEAAAAKLLGGLLWNPNADPVTDSVAELRRLAGAMRDAVDVLGSRLNHDEVCESCGRGPEPLDGATGTAWVRVLRELRQILAEMERLGLEKRQVEFEEDQAQRILAAFLDGVAVAREVLSAELREAMVAAFLEGLGHAPVLEVTA